MTASSAIACCTWTQDAVIARCHEHKPPAPACHPARPACTFCQVRGQAAHKDLLAARLLAHALRNGRLCVNLQ